MTYVHQNGDGIDSLSFNQLAGGARGNGIVTDMNDLPSPSDCEPTLSDATDSVIIDVAAGTAAIDGARHGVATSSVVLEDGNSSSPRRDVVYIAEGGSVEVLKGDPGQPATDNVGTEITGASAPLPEAPDMSNVTGVPVAVVWVPRGATSSTDLDPERDVWDRRVPVRVPERTFRHTITFPVSALEGRDGDVMETGGARTKYVPVRPGGAIRLYKWGIRLFHNATEEEWEHQRSLEHHVIELVGPAGEVLSATNDPIQHGDPVIEVDAEESLSDVADFYFRLRNVAPDDLEPPSGITAYAEFEVAEP